jgi:cystathionine gamma-synthase (EC 2.5.1.48)
MTAQDRSAPDLALDTLAVREALPRSQYGENSEALFLTSSFVHPDAATAAARFAGEQEGFVYSRFSNPTVSSYEQRLAALEGAEGCMATGSGMAAILLLAMALLKAGDHVICSQGVFGSTINLFGRELARFGVETTFVSQTDVTQWAAALRPKTRLLFAETPSNPLTEVCDIAALADLAHDAGAQLVVDNCFCSPALQRPLDFGADWVIHSGTKYLDGQGRVIAGAVCGKAAPIHDKLLPVQRTIGLSLSPFNAWVVLKGMETLGVRMMAHSAARSPWRNGCRRSLLSAACSIPASIPIRSMRWPCVSKRPGVPCCRSSSRPTMRSRPKRGRFTSSTTPASAPSPPIWATPRPPSPTRDDHAWPPERSAAAGCGHRPGADPPGRGLEDVGDLQRDLSRGLQTLS